MHKLANIHVLVYRRLLEILMLINLCYENVCNSGPISMLTPECHNRFYSYSSAFFWADRMHITPVPETNGGEGVNTTDCDFLSRALAARPTVMNDDHFNQSENGTARAARSLLGSCLSSASSWSLAFTVELRGSRSHCGVKSLLFPGVFPSALNTFT